MSLSLVFFKWCCGKRNTFSKEPSFGYLVIGIAVSYFILAESSGFLIYLRSHNFIMKRVNRLSI